MWEPFRTMLKRIQDDQRQQRHQQKRSDGSGGVPASPIVVSVDAPCGWNVDEGDVSGMGFLPDVQVSLTTPKHSSKTFPGRHFVGGRFLPPALAAKYKVQMPADAPRVPTRTCKAGDRHRIEARVKMRVKSARREARQRMVPRP
mmetsp:Transcript_12611/g.36705  ORF Transcript_12611/g.36705 Transcript_12611/m.36705 type:complete len:144 (+) Transcript_12611:595-1026(+)